MLLACFLFFLLAFVGIGAASVLKSTGTTEDYLIASKSVSPWMAGLSAVATNNSGYMFIGMIGYTYAVGLQSIWLMIGWIVGDYAGSLLCWRRIREASDKAHVQSFSALLSHWQGGDYRILRRVSVLLIVVFLGAYAAAQLKAADKAVQELLGWPDQLGILVAALVVLIYSIAGGLRASIWTDVAQSFVMLAGMLLLMLFGLDAVGGLSSGIEQLAAVDPHYLDWFPEGGVLSAMLFVGGWLAGGIAVLGQPHIVIRFMAVRDTKSLHVMRGNYYLWFTLFYGATIAVGLLARILPLGDAGFDAETALPLMAVNLLPEALAGLILAALFAATMSTADSLVISCSAALVRDIGAPQRQPRLLHAKLATAGIVLLSVLIALGDNQSVFRLVLMAWGLLASAFAPYIMLCCLHRTISESRALFMMAAGIGVFLLWRWMGWGSIIYEVAPGMAAGLLAGLPGTARRATDCSGNVAG